MRLKVVLTVVTAILVSAASAQAGTLSVVPSLAGGGEPVVGSNLIDIRIAYEPDATNEYWGGVSFSLDLGGGVTDVSGWIPAEGSYEVEDGGFVGSPHWVTNNVDTTGNLVDILIQPSPSEAANRLYGQENRPADGAGPDRWTFVFIPPITVIETEDDLGWPTLIGQVEVNWDGTPGFVGVRPGSDSSWTTFVDDGGGDFTAKTETRPIEPNQLMFLGPPAGRRVGLGDGGRPVDVTLDASAGNTLRNLNLGSTGVIEILNHPGTPSGDLEVWLNVTGGDIPQIVLDLNAGDVVTASAADGNPFDDANANLLVTFPGLAPRGGASHGIVFNYDFGDGSGIDTITVPEPSTMLLVGLGLVGLAGVRRRRRNG